MKKVRVEKAVGMVLGHDITRIIPGKFKGVGFRKGHVIQEADIPELIRLGKNHIYALSVSGKDVHEDDAALRIATAICGQGIRWTDPKEGKSNMISERGGLLKVCTTGLLEINRMENIIVSTLKNNFPCHADQTVAATRIIPLTIEAERIARLESVAQTFHPILRVMPYKRMKVGAIVTGTEIYNGLIQDEFDEFVGSRVRSFGCDIVEKILVPDDPKAIAEAIWTLMDIGCDLILTTGGLSVDPDDATRTGIQQANARIIAYGAPILPGAMFLYAFVRNTPLLGLPACVYYHPSTIFDLMFPRVLAGDEITEDDIARMGHGGLCMNCKKCRYPICPFGK